MATTGGPNIEKLGWFQVYKWTEFNTVSTFVYDIDNTLTAPATFSRILYIMRIDNYHVWIELDDFTGGDVTKVGVPLTWVYDIPVTNMIVKFKNAQNFPGTNTATIYNRLTPVDGKLNFWPSGYSTKEGLYDHDDSNYNTGDGHGSFQFFDMTPTTPECIFAWNYWGKGTSDGTFGMGSRNTSHPDWTFAYNGASFTKREGNVYIK